MVNFCVCLMITSIALPAKQITCIEEFRQWEWTTVCCWKPYTALRWGCAPSVHCSSQCLKWSAGMFGVPIINVCMGLLNYRHAYTYVSDQLNSTIPPYQSSLNIVGPAWAVWFSSNDVDITIDASHEEERDKVVQDSSKCTAHNGTDYNTTVVHYFLCRLVLLTAWLGCSVGPNMAEYQSMHGQI